jgi:hypothetical protein
VPDFVTPYKGLTEPTVGGDNNTWGGLLNTDLSLIDSALGGTLVLSISGNTTLTSTQTENSGYEFTGTLTGTATITWPSFAGMTAIQNGTTGGFSISCGISGGAFVTVPNGQTVIVWSDGTNFIAPPRSISLAAVSYNSSATIANADNGKTIVLGGTDFYSVTLGATSGYDSNASYLLINPSTTRGKSIIITGGTNFILWPGQRIQVQNVSGSWSYNPTRWRPLGFAPTFYVDNVNGDDASDGLDSSGSGVGCFKTVQNAVNTCYLQLDIVTEGAARIQLPPTTSTPITEQVIMAGSIGGYQFDLLIIGNPSNPGLCQWFQPTSAGGTCVSVSDYATVTLDGITFGVTTGSVNFLLESRQYAIVDIQSCGFLENPAGAGLVVHQGSRANILGPTVTISGNLAALFQIEDSGSISAEGVNLNIVGNPNIGNFVFMSGAGCYMDFVNGTFGGNTAGLGGIQYVIQGPNAFAQSGVMWPPDMSAGSVSNGGQVF